MVAKNAEDMSKVETVDSSKLNGNVINQDGIINFENVPIITPNGDVLVHSLNFKVTSGMNCLITGPNG
jgi:ATP-binding cassette subfamily D (ALD) protein 3